MYFSSRFATWLAVVLAITLSGFGVSTLQAKDKNQHNGCGCPAPVVQKPCCPAPVIHPATVEAPCCPLPVVRKPCPAPPPCCGGVDNTGDISKAEKEALHAQHEAQEACKKQSKAVAKAQHELAEEQAKQQRRIDRANAHLNHEVGEFV